MENTKAIYANKFNVTVDENEACLSFYWVMILNLVKSKEKLL